MLQEKDQILYQQVCQSRDTLQQSLHAREQELTLKNTQLVSMGQSLQELQVMVASLKAMASVKEELTGSNQAMKRQLQMSEMQIRVMKKEVDTVADYLICKEHND